MLWQLFSFFSVRSLGRLQRHEILDFLYSCLVFQVLLLHLDTKYCIHVNLRKRIKTINGETNAVRLPNIFNVLRPTDMTTPRFARGTKSRIFLYLGIAVFIFIALCAFHETQSRMDEVKKSAEKCQQQQESLAAQLQVIFEYKLRLEKSVQQEKAEHRHTREELQTQLEEERAKRAKEVLEATNKLASLQQHYKLLQGQHDDLTEECNKARETRDKEIEQLKAQVLQLKTENERLVIQAKEAVNQGRQAAALASSLKSQNQQLNHDLSEANIRTYKQQQLLSQAGNKASAAPTLVAGHLQSPPVTVSPSSPSSPSRLSAPIAAPSDQQSVLNVPNIQYKLSSVSTAARQSTNSNNKGKDNNKVDPVPAPGPDLDNVGAKPAVEKENMVLNDDMQRIPAGVVPAPNVYHNDPVYGLGDAQDHPVHLGRVQRREAMEMSENGGQGKAVGAAPPEAGENKAWKVAGEEEEEGGDAVREGHAYRQYHPQESYKEEEGELDERGAAQHPAGGAGGEHALGEPHEDLQLEDVEEDDDDDVDQIDYGNEMTNYT
ncbi:hypothetical protein B566_EDAN010779 [Ephemera danica]|nr:hypothetical protein B566_EDAN010779 [Ephemera danica]